MLVLAGALAFLIALTGGPILGLAVLPILSALLASSVDRWIDTRLEGTAERRASHAADGAQGRTPRPAPVVQRTVTTRSSPTAGKRHSPKPSTAQPTDYQLLVRATLFLLAFGALMVYSASSTRPGFLSGQGDALRILARVLAYSVFGLVLTAALAADGIRYARRATTPVLVAAFLLLLAFHLPGVRPPAGGRPVLHIPGLQVQPSAIMELGLLLFAAATLNRVQKPIAGVRALFRLLLPVFTCGCVLLFTEPDAGSVLVVGAVTGMLLVVAGTPLRSIALLAGLAIAIALVFASSDQQLQPRLIAFIDPWSHAATSGFQLVQSSVGIGSGGVLGRGIGESVQKALYLPQANTDSILAVVGEELGVLGVTVLLYFYGIIALVGLRAAAAAASLYEALVAVGVTSLILSQVVLNVFAVLGLAPLAGVPLPFISYAPTNLLLTLAGVGLLLNVLRRNATHAAANSPIVRDRPAPVSQRRTLAVFLFFLVLLVLGGARDLYFGTLYSGKLRAVADAQQLRRAVIPAFRGTILDRSGKPLVASGPAADVSATPYLIRNRRYVAGLLAPLLGIRASTVVKDLSQRTGYVYLARRLPAGRAQAVLALQLPGIAVTPTTTRLYPQGKIAVPVLGVVGIDGGGLAGLEYSRDHTLRGKLGVATTVLNARGQAIAVNVSRAAVRGGNLRLTIDGGAQKVVDSILDDVGRRFKPRSIAAIIVSADVGAILVAANWNGGPPEVGATQFVAAIKDDVVQLTYDPGLTFSFVPVAGAFEHGGVASTAAGARPPLYSLTEPSAIRAAAQSQGVFDFNSWVQRFGFGTRTGVDLPGEEPGYVPPLPSYSGAAMMQLPVGLGLRVTPTQMVMAYAAIANGGVARVPYVVAEEDGHAVAPRAGRRVMTAATSAKIRGLMGPTGVIAGTAPTFDTGTSSYSSTSFVSSLAGVAPVPHPSMAVVVVVAGTPRSVDGAAAAGVAYAAITRFAIPYFGTGG
jgi:cell division protein FtsW (lipid II flippase)/cell division protein FtsI/penicillin-binding protein 2